MGYRVDTLMAQHADAKLTDLPRTLADRPKARSAGLHGHSFDRVRAEHAIEDRLTKPSHPWTNGQVQRMNRTIRFELRAVEPCATRRLISGGEAYFALAMESRLLRGLRSFPRRHL
jgi:transposase InsO family protein